MDTLEALRLYVTIAETGSFSAAARQVSVSTSTVTVALQQLEEQARVSLITRSTRRLSFTFEGRRFLADGQADASGRMAGCVVHVHDALSEFKPAARLIKPIDCRLRADLPLADLLRLGVEDQQGRGR